MQKNFISDLEQIKKSIKESRAKLKSLMRGRCSLKDIDGYGEELKVVEEKMKRLRF